MGTKVISKMSIDQLDKEVIGLMIESGMNRDKARINADTMSRFELEQYLFDMTNAVDSHSIRG
jgi:hypothetical protein